MNLVIMAAGMGSRFGGLKQLTPVGPNGEFLIDYSIYDAKKAGVNKVIFIIKEEIASLFKETIGKRIEPFIEVCYVYQKLDDIPVDIPNLKREKPWGTGQALLTSATVVDGPFMIINADDFYGRDAFMVLAKFLRERHDNWKKHYGMVAYSLENTLSSNGSVSRGICEVENGYLESVTERTKIFLDGERTVYQDGAEFVEISGESPVSVNLFGFRPGIFEDAKKYFEEFFMQVTDLAKEEFYLPTVVQRSIDDGVADVLVLRTDSKFHGMTYKEDLEGLKIYIQKLIDEGIYPNHLWEEEL